MIIQKGTLKSLIFALLTLFGISQAENDILIDWLKILLPVFFEDQNVCLYNTIHYTYPHKIYMPSLRPATLYVSTQKYVLKLISFYFAYLCV